MIHHSPTENVLLTVSSPSFTVSKSTVPESVPAHTRVSETSAKQKTAVGDICVFYINTIMWHKVGSHQSAMQDKSFAELHFVFRIKRKLPQNILLF